MSRLMHTVPLRGVSTAVIFAAVLATTATLLESQAPPQRIVAIGDIHGSFDGFTTILRRTGLVNNELRWTGGRAILVQTGDYTDRGRDVRKVMDLLMALEREAKSAGGEVIALMGNHEIMNLLGDLRDVTPEICGTFATPESVERIAQGWRRYQRLARDRASVMPILPPVYAQTREEWIAAHPPGCLEYREALAPNGQYGRWLRRKDIATIVGGTLFMHAGLNPARVAPKSIDEVNDRARVEVRRFDSYRRRLERDRLALTTFGFQDLREVTMIELQLASAALAAAKVEGNVPLAFDAQFVGEARAVAELQKWSLVDPEGPLWFRGYAQWPENTTKAYVTSLLVALKVSRIVVAHTPTPDRLIASRYDGRVFVIDTGMLAEYYRGEPAALEISGERIKAVYSNREVDLSP